MVTATNGGRSASTGAPELVSCQTWEMLITTFSISGLTMAKASLGLCQLTKWGPCRTTADLWRSLKHLNQLEHISGDFTGPFWPQRQTSTCLLIFGICPVRLRNGLPRNSLCSPKIPHLWRTALPHCGHLSLGEFQSEITSAGVESHPEAFTVPNAQTLTPCTVNRASPNSPQAIWKKT